MGVWGLGREDSRREPPEQSSYGQGLNFLSIHLLILCKEAGSFYSVSETRQLGLSDVLRLSRSEVRIHNQAPKTQ